jgi:glutamine amidotransferase
MIAIIDYNMGNPGSIQNMLSRIGTESEITSDLESIQRADRLILPGVGAFDTAMQNLQQLGLVPVLNEMVLRRCTPILGICLGMQLFSRCSEEGVLQGFGWIDAETLRFSFDEPHKDLRLPHMGWNSVSVTRPSPLFDGLEDDARFYFVHSYHVCCRDAANVLATATYGMDFHCAVARGNIMGTQFHPEKSHKYGLTLLRNFVEASA